MNWWVFRYSTKYSDAATEDQDDHIFLSAGEKNITCPHAFYVEKLDCSKFEGLASNIWVWAAGLENPSSSPAPLYPARPWGHWTIAPNMPVLKVAYVTSSVIQPPFAGNWGFIGEFPCTGTFKDLMIGSRPDQYHSFIALQTVCALS
jgi:hypothetical protein